MRTVCPWHDLPEEFGSRNTIYQKFNRWSAKNKLLQIFKSLIKYPDLECEFIDGSIVRAYQRSSGATGVESQAIGKSVDVNTTKIHIAVDAFGLPIEFELTGGEVHDCEVAPKLIDKLPVADYTIAEKGYDSQDVRTVIRNKSSIPVNPRKSNSKTGNADMECPCINLGIWLKTYLLELNISAVLQLGMTN